MNNYFYNFREAYGQTTFEFGVADIFTDDSADLAARVGSFVLLMNQATVGKDGHHVRGGRGQPGQLDQSRLSRYRSHDGYTP